MFFGLLTIARVRSLCRSPRPPRRYAIVACLFAASLLCKSMFVTLPAVLLLLDHWPLRRARPWRTLVIEKLPLLGIAGRRVRRRLPRPAAPAARSAELDRYPLPLRLGNAAVAYLGYLRSVRPDDLAVFYPHPRAFQLATLILAVIVLVDDHRPAPSPRRRTAPWMLIGWLWFLGTLVPMIGLSSSAGRRWRIALPTCR